MKLVLGAPLPRRWLARAAGVLALAVSLAWLPGTERGRSAAAAAGPERPSIVLILTDDQRWDTLWGMRAVNEALAAHGVTFRNSFVVNPLCCPSRASLLTGRYSHTTGVYLNTPPHGGFRSFRDRSTIATVLHAAGYTTGLVGKYLNGYGRAAADVRYVPPGWDHWTTFLNKTAYYDYRLVDDGRVTHYGYGRSAYSTDVLARKAVAFVARASRPFFLEFTPYAPHPPTTPARRYAQAFDNAPWTKPPSFDEADVSDKPLYIQRLRPFTPTQLEATERFRRDQLAATLSVDDAVRGIVKALKHRHMLRKTMIVFSSDNGVAWGEHLLVPGRKVVPYEESIRVPLVIRYDPLTHGRRRADGRLALNIDLAPTFAALAGRTMPRAEGRSLLPLLSDRHPSWRHDFLIEHLGGPPQRAVPTYCAVRSGRFKYVLYQTGEEELYDLATDPYELENRASTPGLAALKAGLRSRLETLCRPPPPGYTALEQPPARP